MIITLNVEEYEKILKIANVFPGGAEAMLEQIDASPLMARDTKEENGKKVYRIKINKHYLADALDKYGKFASIIIPQVTGMINHFKQFSVEMDELVMKHFCIAEERETKKRQEMARKAVSLRKEKTPEERCAECTESNCHTCGIASF